MLVTLSGAEDWPLWRAARLAALADSPDAFPMAAAEWAEGGEGRWRERLLDVSALKVVAVVDDAPVGLVRGVFDNGSPWLHSLWVSPRLRGQGLGDQLIAAVEEWARPRAGYVRLEVVPANAPAIALYRRHGFTDDEARGSRLPDGGYELVMKKALG
jgi:ribosomal protein S18 acetylase RimI-like enzyme